MSSPEPAGPGAGDLSWRFAIPVRRLIAGGPDVSVIVGALANPQPVEVVRPADLVHLTFSFVNLQISMRQDGGPPVLSRRARNRPAFLVADFHSQHVIELAQFEAAEGYPVPFPGPDWDPDQQTQPLDPRNLPPIPVFASLSGPSRLVFSVTGQAIPYTVEGLLAAIRYLDLSVAPQALPPPLPRRVRFSGILSARTAVLSGLLGPVPKGRTPPARGRARPEVAPVPTSSTAKFAAIGRMRATAARLEHRFGTDAALGALDGTSIGKRIGIGDILGELGTIGTIEALPPPPAPPSGTETAIELPWRLVISPTRDVAFAASPAVVEHHGRAELWHARMGVRALDGRGKPVVDADGNQTVDEAAPDRRVVRALWARDFDILPAAHGRPAYGFVSPPSSENFPDASGSEDWPRERTSLNSRDRMMLVHETSNFHLVRGHTQAWAPRAIRVGRLMLTALGGWLDSTVTFPTLPDGGLTIEEWKHRAALGRDHQVKVVYAGFLLPFGHKASLVKITERKFADGPSGTTAYLFQRMYLVVREPEKNFRKDPRALPDGRRLDLVMPFSAVRIETRVTPPLDPPERISAATGSGLLFEPHVLKAPFLFKMTAVDLEGNIAEFSAPLVFMERDLNTQAALQNALDAYNTSHLVDREFDLRGQKVAFAESTRPDDTAVATSSVTFEAETAPFLGDPAVPQDEPRFTPALREARAVVPAMSALASAATPTRLAYHPYYAGHEFEGNAAEVFLQALDSPPLNFAGQGDRSGGFVTPSLNVKGLSRLTGPLGGDLDKAIQDPGSYSVSDFFAGISAKLFGLIPLKELFGTLGFTPDRVPTFVSQTLDIATTLSQNAERLRNAADQQAAALGASAANLRDHTGTLVDDIAKLLADPASPPNLLADLQAVAGDLDPFIAAVDAAAPEVLPQAAKQQLTAIAQRIRDQLVPGDPAAIEAAVGALTQFAQGFKLPEVVTARIDWSTGLDPWPAPGNDAIFSPVDAAGKITLAVEIQAPTRPGKDPSVLVSCSIAPFDLRLIGPVTFIVLHFQTMDFSIVPGKKPDVNVAFRDPDGITFAGPLEFVNTLKDIIPFNGFSDPPYLDVTAEGIKSGFDLAIPDLAVGVFALTNINLGAVFKVPFIDESIETSFNFATRDNPFRLQVALFAGGGFFGITITPQEVRILEAAFEFGAAISVNFGVASGGVSVIAGIYFRLETEAGHENAQLTGYFRMHGEVDVLGLISASITLYLELTYQSATKKAVGRATITIEIEIFFFSFSVSISCEKQFAGSDGDPSFADVMGLPAAAPPGTVRPWDLYCHAFADD